MHDYALEPFIKLYENHIKTKEPITNDNCSIINQFDARDTAEYLLKKLYETKRFRADFLMDWVNINNAIKDLKPNQTKIFIIAFRENGVDGYSYVGLRAENGKEYFDEFYSSKKVYMIVCTANEKEINTKLYNIYDDIINNFDLFKEYINA